jgi:hypothetical protein
MAEFVERTGTSGFPQVADEGARVWAALGAEIRSSFLFLDGETGETRRTGYGQMDEDTLRRSVEELLT